jgi:hypothetical protein
VVDFKQALRIHFNRQHLPLATDIERLQDVVEDLAQRQRLGGGPRRPQLRWGKTNRTNRALLNFPGIACRDWLRVMWASKGSTF